MDLKRALRAKRGQGLGIAGGALLVVVGGAFLFIGILLKSEISGAIDRSAFSAAENTTFTDTSSNVDTAFSLLGVGMIVVGAGVIIRFLRGAF